MGRGERYLSSSTVDYVDVPAVIVDVVVAVDVDVDVAVVVDVYVAVDVVDVVIVGERGEGRRGGGVGSGMDPAWVVGSGMERGVGERVEKEAAGMKRKLAKTGFKTPHDSDYDDDEPYEYNSGDDVEDGNKESFIEKEAQKIREKGKAA
ncbi:pax-interacting protein 1 [Hordeum vulgare]|nr:pax-interacting protein 1 [Hordeum vulgare]